MLHTIAAHTRNRLMGHSDDDMTSADRFTL